MLQLLPTSFPVASRASRPPLGTLGGCRKAPKREEKVIFTEGGPGSPVPGKQGKEGEGLFPPQVGGDGLQVIAISALSDQDLLPPPAPVCCLQQMLTWVFRQWAQ